MGATTRIRQFIDYKGVTKYKFCKNLGFSNKFLDNSENMGTDKACKILHQFPELNPEWLITGKGEMIKSNQNLSNENENNLIPLYDDAITIGGSNIAAEPSTSYGNHSSIEYINAGDWFPNITAGIRHYGDSMIEYPNGCILALREITSVHNIVWGRNYVIETDEIRVTKRMQTNQNKNFITAYSTNTETYPDGRLVHEPLEIDKNNIRKIFLVLGRIVKEHSSGVYPTK